MKPSVFLTIATITTASLCAEIPIAANAELKLVADGFKFTEGPATDRHGNVYFTDQPNDRILKWNATTGKVETFLEPSGRANGMDFDKQGFLISCADEKGQLQRINIATKERTTIIENFAGGLLNGPNDVWVRPDGGMYFTDPFYKRPYWKNRDSPDQKKERVYFLAAGAKIPVAVEEEFKKPNGIIGSPDGKLLYIADIGDGKTWRYEINEDGSLTKRTLFCELGSDGMTIDSSGNVYLTGKEVTVFDKNGKNLGKIEVPRSWNANITFAGPDHNLLFITALDAVFTLEMTVTGSGKPKP
jgi:gluconolactonase